MTRLAIPAEIKRAVLVEAGHRCAIPRCGQTELEIHHIVPWETCKKHEYSNLIALCLICHKRAHDGDIDRKSLFLYKENLAADLRRNDPDIFSAPVIELKRRIYEKCDSVPGYTFCFDFPDFQEPVERIVSRNIEAWGYELLAEYRNNQETYIPVEGDGEEIGFFRSPAKLMGDYFIVRRDSKVVSVKYSLYRYYTGAAHGGTTTRVQNFLIRPFKPITLDDLFKNASGLLDLSELVYKQLFEMNIYEEEWLRRGTKPEAKNFSRFNIGKHGITFTFPEYQIACFSAGEQNLSLSFYELRDILDKNLLELLPANDLSK